MSASETPFPDSPNAAPAPPGGDQTRTTLERQLHLLGDLAEAGLVMAEAVAREVSEVQAGQGSSSRVVADLALAFERVSRAVRYTVMLQGRLVGELQAWERAQSSKAEMEAYQARAALEAQRLARKAQVAGALGQIIAEDHANDTEAPDTEAKDTEVRESRESRERLVAERLRDDARIGDILTLPVSEVIDLICRDLGIQPDWLRLSEQEWARGELRSGKVGAALAAAVLSGAPPGDPFGDTSSDAGRQRTPLSRPSWRPPIRAAEAPRRRRAAG